MESTDRFSYDEYDRLTRAYVDEQAGVNYAVLKEELAALKDFIDQFADASPENNLNGSQTKMNASATT